MRAWTVGLAGLAIMIGVASCADNSSSESETDPDPRSRLQTLLRQPFDLAEHSRFTAEISSREWGTSTAGWLCFRVKRQGPAAELLHYESACLGTPLVQAVSTGEHIFARRHGVPEWHAAPADPSLYREMLTDLLEPQIESSQLADALDHVTSNVEGDLVAYSFTLDSQVLHPDTPEDLDMEERGTASFDQQDRLVEITVHHSTELDSGFDLRTTIDYSSSGRIPAPTPQESVIRAGRLATVDDLHRFLASAGPA